MILRTTNSLNAGDSQQLQSKYFVSPSSLQNQEQLNLENAINHAFVVNMSRSIAN